MDWTVRTRMLLGSEAEDRLKKACVWVFGVGGVGSFAAMALVRSGVGKLILVDNDRVEPSNINRQLQANVNTVGRGKAKALSEMLLEINPSLHMEVIAEYYSAQTADQMDFSDADYVVDAIDSVTSKLLLIERAKKWGVPIISAMGAGNKLDATRFEVCDIKQTSVCPLAKVMRRELKKRGIDSLKVVYSKEEPRKAWEDAEKQSEGRRAIPASCSFVPPVCGMILAGEVVCDIAGIQIR